MTSADLFKERLQAVRLIFQEKEAASALRSRVKVIKGHEHRGFDVFLDGKKIQTIFGETTPKGFRISLTDALPKHLLGLGLGKKVYGDIARLSPKRTLLSDMMVSPSASRVYESFTRRPTSYRVTRNPLTRVTPGGYRAVSYWPPRGLLERLRQWLNPPQKSVFEVTQLRQAKKQAASALRRRIRVVKDIYGSFDVFLDGKKIQRITGATTLRGFQIHMTGKLPQRLLNMGLGKKIYGEMAKQSPKRTLLSDQVVSQSASRVYESFARRPASYQVTRNPLTEITPSLIFNSISTPGGIRFLRSPERPKNAIERLQHLLNPPRKSVFEVTQLRQGKGVPSA